MKRHLIGGTLNEAKDVSAASSSACISGQNSHEF
jgi:hypothetical protein